MLNLAFSKTMNLKKQVYLCLAHNQNRQGIEQKIKSSSKEGQNKQVFSKVFCKCIGDHRATTPQQATKHVVVVGRYLFHGLIPS